MNIYKISKIILTIFPFLGLLVFVAPESFRLFGEFAWRFLIVLLFIRPLKDIFPENKFLSKAVTLRKELGIISGSFALAHLIGYFLFNGLPVPFIFDSIMWDPRGYLGWGMYSFIVAMVLYLTSNKFSMIKMGKHWKKIQRLSYLMLFLVAVHIALIKEGAMISTIITVSSYIMIFLLAYRYKKF